MVEHDTFTENVLELENLLVRQFRSLQTLIKLTRAEREAMLNGSEDVMRLVEDKEALLDQLGLMEDSRRMVIQDLIVELRLRSETTSLGDLLPHLEPDQSSRLGRLAEGIHMLAVEARELNHANQALAFARLDWLKAAQSFLIEMAQPEAGYRPPGASLPKGAPAWGVEYRA